MVFTGGGKVSSVLVLSKSNSESPGSPSIHTLAFISYKLYRLCGLATKIPLNKTFNGFDIQSGYGFFLHANILSIISFVVSVADSSELDGIPKE